MPENGTYRLSGGRRRALWWAPPPTRHRRSGGIEPTRPRGGKGAPAGGTVGGKDGQPTEVGSRLHVTTTDSRTGQTSLRDGGGHRLASWPSGYATARSEAVCRGAGCGRTRTSGSVGGQGQQRPWSTRPYQATAHTSFSINFWTNWSCLRVIPSLRVVRHLGVNGNRKPHICGNRKLHTPGEDVSGGADILPVMPVGRVGLDAGSGATGVLANTRREAADPAVTWRLPHAVRPTLSSASADAPASGSCCPGC